MSTWTAADIPDQSGRIAIITGANTGLGYETALALAEHGAHVVVAVRDTTKGTAAAGRILEAAPTAKVDVHVLDLGSLESVRTAAGELAAQYPRIDLLINNAGVMYPPKSTTADGFELQFGTNHLGHFAFTGLLLNNLLPVPGSRVVTVASIAHTSAKLDLDDLQWERRRYDRPGSYGASKLSNLLFTYELQRRLAAKDEPTIAVAAHPGVSNTELMRHVPGSNLPVVNWVADLVLNSVGQGALPTLRAATDPAVTGGQYYGPDGFRELRGHPKLVRSNATSHDRELQTRLWTVSEELTGVTYPV